MREYRLRTKYFVTVTGLIALACSGCTLGRHRIEPKMGRYDLEPQYRSAAFLKSDADVSNAPRVVKIDVESRFLGRNWKSNSRRIRPAVVAGLTANNAFVEADETNASQAGHLLVVVNHQTSPKKFAEAMGIGAVSGLTFGLVSFETDNMFDMTVTYTPIDGQPIAWKCSHPVHTTVGVKAMLRNENTLEPVDVLPELSEGMAARFATDFAVNSSSTQYVQSIPSNDPHASTPMVLPQTVGASIREGSPTHVIEQAAAADAPSTYLR